MREFEYAILDMDLPIFRAAASAQKTWYDLYDDTGEFLETFSSAKECKSYLQDLEEFMEVDTSNYKRESRLVVGEFEDAVDALEVILKHYMKKANARKAKYFIGGDSSKNFRIDVATIKEYKSGRSAEKPIHLKRLIEYAKEKYDVVIADGCETDDLVSIAIYHDYLKGFKSKDKSKCECVLVSEDKDASVTPGFNINPAKDDEPSWITTQDARKWLFEMALGGDSCDGIVGAPGVGYKTAATLLEGCKTEKEYWSKTVEVFEDAYRKHCSKPKGKKEGKSIDEDGNLTYKNWKGEVVTRHISDIAEENVNLVYMLRESVDERWKRPQ